VRLKGRQRKRRNIENREEKETESEEGRRKGHDVSEI
jgi:hypothetical protein